MEKREIETRGNYSIYSDITTRWMDNDVYGHVNNVVYYSYFDTAANQYLVEVGGLDIKKSPVIAYVVNSGCNYNSAITYPDKLEAGLRVDQLGSSSVQYGLAIFRQGEDVAAAQGYFVHVFVDRKSNRPVPIPEKICAALKKILVN